MNTFMSPWEIAYIKLKEHYSKEEIDNMPWSEIIELLSNEARDGKE